MMLLKGLSLSLAFLALVKDVASQSCCDPNTRPSCGWAACCPNGQWACHSWYGSYWCGDLGYLSSGFGEPCSARLCTQDVKTCPDGSFVSRDPNRGCAFEPCPLDCSSCPCGYNDGCTCFDGCVCVVSNSLTTYTKGNTCNCNAQNSLGSPVCTLRFCSVTTREPFCLDCPCGEDKRVCPGGTSVGRNPDNNCEFYPCPNVCTQDVKTCADGSVVNRDPSNNCAFKSCPRPTCSSCPCGFFDGCNTCNCDPGNSVGQPLCTQIFCSLTTREPSCLDCPCGGDRRVCSGGTTVGRNPDNSCEFYPCPNVCTQDVKTCADGSFVSRNPDNNCAFDPCPRPTCNSCPCGFFDGCNTCKCNPENPLSSPACSLRFCAETTREPVCLQCTCDNDTRVCPGGAVVGKNPDNGCAFDTCPRQDACCELNAKPGQDFLCCRDGTWKQQFNGWARCASGYITQNDQGRTCADRPLAMASSVPVAKTCQTCPCGYYDGCNECMCDRSTSSLVGCTRRFCATRDIPFCRPCQGA